MQPGTELPARDCGVGIDLENPAGHAFADERISVGHPAGTAEVPRQEAGKVAAAARRPPVCPAASSVVVRGEMMVRPG